MTTQLFAIERYEAGGHDCRGLPELPPTGPARLIGLVRLPEDDVVLAFVEGPDAETVTACLSAVGWRVDRVTPATWLSPPFPPVLGSEPVDRTPTEVLDV